MRKAQSAATNQEGLMPQSHDPSRLLRTTNKRHLHRWVLAWVIPTTPLGRAPTKPCGYIHELKEGYRLGCIWRQVRRVFASRSPVCLGSSQTCCTRPHRPYVNRWVIHRSSTVLCQFGRGKKRLAQPGFEPETFCVLDRCDNQLHHRTA